MTRTSSSSARRRTSTERACCARVQAVRWTRSRCGTNRASRSCPELSSSGSGFAREIAFHVDAKLALGESVDAPVLYPLLGNLVEDPALGLPVHEMARTLHGESQLVVVLDAAIELRD